MHKPSIAAAAVILFGAGCGVAPAGGSPTPGSVPGPIAELLRDAPVFDPSAEIGYDFMLPGVGLVTGDAVHLWAVGFGERGDEEVIHLTSSDGTAWDIGERRVEEEIGLELNPPGPIPATVLPGHGDAWVMYFSASPEGGVDGADIWRATAPGPSGPWTADREPVLARADVPTESGGMPTQLDFPAVVRTDAGYHMLFGWSPSRATTLIRSATSADGVSWAVAETPAIDLGLCGGFDTRSVVMPRMAAGPAGGGWIALYGGFAASAASADESMALGLARSTDGTAWSCASPAPVLETADLPRSERIHSYALLASEDAAPRLLVESLVGVRSELWLAELRLN